MAVKGGSTCLLFLTLIIFFQHCVCDSIWRSGINLHPNNDKTRDLQSKEFITMNENHDFDSTKQGYRFTNVVQRNHHCSCFYFNDSYYAAHCEGPNITHVPDTMPLPITLLYISKSSIRALDLSTILRYTRLTRIFITYNIHLKSVRGGDSLITKSNVVEADLSNNAIQNIQIKSFRHMRALQKLNLSKNNITRLNNHTFYGAENLLSLNLSRNAIVYVENGTFDDLRHLLFLDMSANTKIGCSWRSISPRLFKNLKRMEFLDMHLCSVDLASCKAIAELTNLRELHADAFSGKPFFPEMKLLRSFSTVHFLGVCNITVINETFFQNTPYLKIVEFQSCPINRIDPNTFEYIQHLESWTIQIPSKNYNLTKGLSDLQGLNNISLKYLALRHFSNSVYSIWNLDAEHAKYLNPLPLETLDLTGNNIAKMKLEFIKLLPKTLKRLVLNENSIYSNVEFMNLLQPLKNIVSISLSNQGCLDFYCKIHTLLACDENTESCQHTEKNKELTKQNTDFQIGTENQTIPLILPPNLKTIYGAYNSLIATSILCSNVQAASLVKLDLSHGYLPGSKKCHMPSTVKEADLSHNFCNQLNDVFLSNNSSKEYFNIRNNFLGHAFMNQAANIFNNQKQLMFLDISNNYIYALPATFFRGLTNLQFLNASHNKFEVLNVNFSGLYNLTYIDFSNNLIVQVSHKTRSDLDLIASLHPVFLFLGNNPLMCTCYGLELFIWLATTEVDVSSSRNLRCMSDAGKSQKINDLEKFAEELRIQCTSKSTMIMICVSCLVFLFLLTTVSLVYRYRWRLRYIKSVALMKLLASTNYTQLPDLYKFDAYICMQMTLEILCSMNAFMSWNHNVDIEFVLKKETFCQELTL